MTLLIYLVFVFACILIDAVTIEVLNKQITKWGHRWRWLFQAVCTAWFLYLEPMDYYQSIPTYAITFWFLFDTGLNAFRGRKLFYLGNNFIDKLQKKYPNELVWFVFKAIAFLGFFGMYYLN